MNDHSAPAATSLELAQLRQDLIDEQQSLDEVVASLSHEQWRRATASPGWSVADQIGHLTYFDAAAARAISQPDHFRRDVADLLAASATTTVDEYTLRNLRALPDHRLLDTWRHHRDELADAARSLHDAARVAWYGPSMGAKSFLSARLMEVWAHGTDVVDALDARRAPSDRLRHVVQLGFNTRQWSYAVRGEAAPSGDVALELSTPTGELWRWGGPDASDVVRGSAEEFCLVVTQRRHLDDTSLVVNDLGRHWLVRAQAFAGTASNGPQPRSNGATH